MVNDEMDNDARAELVAVLHKRIEELRRQEQKVVENARPKRREIQKRQVKGRIKECLTLKDKLSQDKLGEYVGEIRNESQDGDNQ